MTIRNFFDDIRYEKRKKDDYRSGGSYRNDYSRDYKPYRRGRRGGFFTIQLFIAILCFGTFAYLLDADNVVGEKTREVVSWALSEENSVVFGGSVDVPPETTIGVETESKLMMPVSGLLARSFAVFGSETPQYDGIDISAQAGSSVRSAASGKVTEVRSETDSYYVTIEHNPSMLTHYGGLAEVSIKVGDKVRQGDVIGTAGENPMYFAIFVDGGFVDPIAYIKESAAK